MTQSWNTVPVEKVVASKYADTVKFAWSEKLRQELLDCILPFWAGTMLDPKGGIYGGRDYNDKLLDHLPRSAVLGTRVLWTFASAEQFSPDPRWRKAAEHAWQWLTEVLWDKSHGGVYWSVNAQHRVTADHKQSYAQGFGIYACVAYYRMSGETAALDLAKELYRLLEAAHDQEHGGYFEGCSREWVVLEDARLSKKELLAPKSMNTMLHLLEGLTELLRVWPDDGLQTRLRELIELFLCSLWQPKTASFGLFFARNWQNLSSKISYGHDIETGWLLNRAAKVLGDPDILARTHAISILVADAVIARGVAADGSVLTEGNARTVLNAERHWWSQAEGMLGFWDAFEVSGDERHAQASLGCWHYIENHHLDPKGSDWIKVLDADGKILDSYPKAGPWECPYHHARACMEMLDRLGAQG